MKLPDDIVKQHSEEAWRSGWAGASMKFADEVKHRNECNRLGSLIGDALKERETFRALLQECWDSCDPAGEWPWELHDKVQAALGLSARASDSREDT